MKKIKILLTIPKGEIFKGGVYYYINSIKKYFPNNYELFYFSCGENSKSFIFPFKVITEIIKYLLSIIKFKPDIIHLNPSIDTKSFYREIFFGIIAKLLKAKIIIFIHGWNWRYAIFYGKTKILRLLNLADIIFVLSNEFKNFLYQQGIKSLVIVETTVVDDELLINNKAPQTKSTFFTILFLSRIIKEKGIFELIEAYEILKKKFTYIRLFICGDGPLKNEILKIISKDKIKDVYFFGWVDDDKKVEIFYNSDLFVFPSYSEGMPISLLEAMAFGLPIITTKVGGINDFFIEGKMGYSIEKIDPVNIALSIEKLISDRELLDKISKYNRKYAKEHFLTSSVVKRLSNYYKSLINENDEIF